MILNISVKMKKLLKKESQKDKKTKRDRKAERLTGIDAQRPKPKRQKDRKTERQKVTKTKSNLITQQINFTLIVKKIIKTKCLGWMNLKNFSFKHLCLLFVLFVFLSFCLSVFCWFF
jgi:hypothetical protein